MPETFRAGSREFDDIQAAIDFAEANDLPEIAIVVDGEVVSTHELEDGGRTRDKIERTLERMGPPTPQVAPGPELGTTPLGMAADKPNNNGNPARFISHTSRQGEWGDEFFQDDILEVDGDEVVISRSPTEAVDRDELDEVAVIWVGALDFEGTLEDARERYPDLTEWLQE